MVKGIFKDINKKYSLDASKVAVVYSEIDGKIIENMSCSQRDVVNGTFEEMTEFNRRFLAFLNIYEFGGEIKLYTDTAKDLFKIKLKVMANKDLESKIKENKTIYFGTGNKTCLNPVANVSLFFSLYVNPYLNIRINGHAIKTLEQYKSIIETLDKELT